MRDTVLCFYSLAEPVLMEGDVFRIVISFSANALASDNEANVEAN